MRFLQVKEHPFVTSSFSRNDFVTPMMSNSLLIHQAAEDLEIIGVITIIRQHFSGDIAAGKQDREEQCRRAPSKSAFTRSLYSRAAVDLRGEQQAKRRYNWINAVDAFRRNQRH